MHEWSQGNPDAFRELMPLVVDEIRQMARRNLALEAADHTLQPTALVNEVYLKLMERRTVEWHSRAQFFAGLAEIMRRVLVDHARTRRAGKRGGAVEKVAFDEVSDLPAARDPDLVALDEALATLKSVDATLYHVVLMRYFMGFTQEESASALSISVNTVGRKWQTARQWLRREMSRDHDAL